jgi:hypothetical protein
MDLPRSCSNTNSSNDWTRDELSIPFYACLLSIVFYLVQSVLQKRRKGNESEETQEATEYWLPKSKQGARKFIQGTAAVSSLVEVSLTVIILLRCKDGGRTALLIALVMLPHQQAIIIIC